MKCFAAAPADGTPTAKTPTVAIATALGLLICIRTFRDFEGVVDAAPQCRRFWSAVDEGRESGA
jgi:hypothetical protein